MRKEQKRTKLEKARAIRAAKSTPFDPQAIKDSIAKAEETNRELAVFLSRPTCPPKDPMEYQMMKAKAQRSDEVVNEKDDDDMLF